MLLRLVAGAQAKELRPPAALLPGGPPHQDMWDIKSDAPPEIRGEFKAIKTNVPGIEIGEPVFFTVAPRTRPSVESIATQRTVFSPRC